MMTIKEINTGTPEGRYLMAAISQLCLLRNQSPDEALEVLRSLDPVVNKMYPEKKIRGQEEAEKLINKHRKG